MDYLGHGLDHSKAEMFVYSVEKDKNQSKIKLIRIDGNTGRMKNNDRSKKLRFESTYADVVRDGFK